MCCRLASSLSSRCCILKLCDSCNAASALLSLEISSTNATIWNKNWRKKKLIRLVKGLKCWKLIMFDKEIYLFGPKCNDLIHTVIMSSSILWEQQHLRLIIIRHLRALEKLQTRDGIVLYVSNMVHIESSWLNKSAR